MLNCTFQLLSSVTGSQKVSGWGFCCLWAMWIFALNIMSPGGSAAVLSLVSSYLISSYLISSLPVLFNLLCHLCQHWAGKQVRPPAAYQSCLSHRWMPMSFGIPELWGVCCVGHPGTSRENLQMSNLVVLLYLGSGWTGAWNLCTSHTVVSAPLCFCIPINQSYKS